MCIRDSNKKDRQESVLAEVHRKNVGFFRHVVRVGGDAYLFRRMVIVRRISSGRLGHRFHEGFGSKRNYEPSDSAEDKYHVAGTQSGRGPHAPDYKGNGCACR